MKNTKGTSVMVATLFLFTIAVAGAGATYGWVLSLTSAQSLQAGTQIRVELVEWDLENNKAIITLRNMGSVEAIIVSVDIKSRSESNFISETDDLPTIDVGVSGPNEFQGMFFVRSWYVPKT